MEESYTDEDIESCRRANYFKNLDKMRVDALASRDALKYFRLCGEMGVEPEDKHLYDIGLMEDSNNSRKQNTGLERKTQEGPVIVPRRKTSKISREMRESFYRLANEQDVVPGKLDDENYPQVVELLCNTLGLRSLNAEGGKMPIMNCEPKQVRAVFMRYYGEAQRQLEPEKVEKTLAYVIFRSVTDRGFSLEDYPDVICDVAESLDMKELNLPSGSFKLSNRQEIQGKTRNEIVSYSKALLRKYNLPNSPLID